MKEKFFTIMDFLYLLNHLLSFILCIYADPNLSRTVVDQIVNFMSDFVCNIYIKSLRKDIDTILMQDKESRFKMKEKILETLKPNIDAILLNRISKVFDSEQSAISDRTSVKLNDTISEHCSIFEKISSEFKRFELLRDKGFREPDHFYIGSVNEKKLKGNEETMGIVKKYGIYIPLRHTLKLFLEAPGLFNEIFNYITELSKNLTL